MVRQNIVLILTTGIILTAVLAIVYAPIIALVIALMGMSVIALILVKGWWRRAYVGTLLAMAIGASHIDALSRLGDLAKAGAVGLLVLATFLTTRDQEASWQNLSHRVTLWMLWTVASLAGISLLWSEARATSVTQTAIFIAFVYVLHRVSTTRWQNTSVLAKDIGTAYWTSTSLLAVGGLLAAGGFPGAISEFSGRYQGIFTNPNLLGLIAAITLVLGIGWALHKRSPMIWVSLIIPASQVILSESRTSMIAAAVAIIWVTISGSVVRTIVAVFTALTVTVFIQAFRIDLWGESLDRFTAMEGGDLFNARTTGWEYVFTYVGENPLGVGWAATTDALAAFNAAGIGPGLSSIHNSYLQLIYELGWLGLVPALFVLALFIHVAFARNTLGIQTGLIATAIAGAIIHFAESTMFGVGQPYPYLFWFAIVAAIVSFDSPIRPTISAEDVAIQHGQP